MGLSGRITARGTSTASLHTKTPDSDIIDGKLHHLSGIDRILDRFKSDQRPKFTLLNDLAPSISPWSDWGAIKARSSRNLRTVIRAVTENLFLLLIKAQTNILPD